MKKSTYKKTNEQEDGVVMTGDPSQAEKLAKKGLNVKLTTEVEHTVENTKLIADEVAESLVKVLEKLGDEVVDYTIDPETNDFHIKVNFSDDKKDSFQFTSDEDEIFYVDGVIDYLLADYGITPGGEVIFNKTYLEDNLEKVFKEKFLTEQSYNKMKTRNILKEQEETQDREEIKVGNYQTHYYDVCPGATALYKDIEGKVEDMDLATRTAKLQDVLFFIEKHVQEEGYEPDPYYAKVAQILADQIMEMAKMMGLESEHDYIQSHVDDIEQAVGKDNLSEATDNKKVKSTVNKVFHDYKDSINKTLNEDYDLGHIDDEVDMLKQEAYEMAIYAGKLYKMLHTLEPYGSEIDFPHWWQGKIIKARDYLGKAVHYLEFELEQPSIDRQMDDHEGEYLQETKQESGLYITGSTPKDDNEIGEVLEDLGLYGEWNVIDGYWFLKEKEEMYDELERILEREFQARNINARFEGVFNESLNEKKKATCCGRCGRVHVKGTECKKPYLSKSSPRHCQNK